MNYEGQPGFCGFCPMKGDHLGPLGGGKLARIESPMPGICLQDLNNAQSRNLFENCPPVGEAACKASDEALIALKNLAVSRITACTGPSTNNIHRENWGGVGREADVFFTCGAVGNLAAAFVNIAKEVDGTELKF